MSTQVLPFDVAESEAPPADEWRDGRSRWKSSLILLVIQLVATLVPVVILVVAFAIAGDRLATVERAGVGLRDILIAIAVLVPFLSQTLAAPIYATLNTVSYRNRGAVSAAVLSVLPRGAILAVPIAAATAVGVTAFRGWGISVAVVLAVSLVLNLVMGMLMVVDFATRSFRGPVLGWVAYGLALIGAPQAAWWLPPLSGAIVLAHECLDEAWKAPWSIRFTSLRTMTGALSRGLSDAIPIWAIPATLWFLAPEAFPAFTVFAAILPAVIAYQMFFALFAGPLWAAVGRLQHALSSVGYATVVETEIATTVRTARRASWAVVGINVALGSIAIAIWAAFGGSDWRTVPLIVGAASAAGCATTLSYQYSIISSGSYLRRAGLALGAVAAVGVLTSAPPTTFLAVYLVVSIALSGLLLGVNRTGWLQPEYRLFWAQAVRL